MYSPLFFSLLPGMKVSPLLMKSKAGSNKLWALTDMSYGTPFLTNLVYKQET